MKEYFLENKYTKWYFRIIENAQLQARNKKFGYFERHHIIPKSIEKNDNTVLLTAKEHFICHLLLTKMCKEPIHRRNMSYALVFIQKGKDITYTSRLYEYFKPIVVRETETHRLENSKKGASKVRGKTYEQLYGVDKANQLKEKRKLDMTDAFTSSKWNDPSYRKKTINRMRGAKKKDSSIENYRKAALLRWAIKKENNDVNKYIWITDNTSNRFVPISSPIPDGWRRGRLNKRKNLMEISLC